MSETARGSIENDVDRTVSVEEASALKLNFCLGGNGCFASIVEFSCSKFYSPAH